MQQTITAIQINPVISAMLTTVLADTMVLYIKTREIPWNIIGNSFLELESLLEDRNNKLEVSIQEIAVLKNNLGKPVSGTLESYLKHSYLETTMAKHFDKNEMLKELLNDHEVILNRLRQNITDCYENYTDKYTGDFLKSQQKKHESIVYNLRIFLTNEGERNQQQIAC